MTDSNRTDATTADANVAVSERTRAIAPAALAVLFGAMMIVGAGFAHSTTLHNAAHDARHAFAFPCH